VSALLAVIAPALHALATELPARAPQGHNIVGAQIAIGSLFSLHILIAGLVSGAAELGPAIEFLGYVRQRRNYDRLAHGMGRFITYYFSVSSTIAILLITVLLVGFWGHFWTTIVTIAWWPSRSYARTARPTSWMIASIGKSGLRRASSIRTSCRSTIPEWPADIATT